MGGYIGFHSNEFVSDEDAFLNAIETIEQDEAEREEFVRWAFNLLHDNDECRKDFVEWFYSGNWIRAKE